MSLSLLALATGVLCTSATPDWIRQRPIVWNEERDRLTREYRRARFGEAEASSQIDPTMIVLHHTAVDTLEGSFRAFDPVRLPASRKELIKASPVNVSTHFLVDLDGTVYQLMPTDRMARHTIGLNWTALGVENVGGNKKALTEAQIEANAKLIRYLKGVHPRIEVLIGHHEYQALRPSAVWKERDVKYLTAKIDPGPRFMAAVREKVKDLGLARLPKDVAPKTDFSKGSPKKLERGDLAGKTLRELALLRNEVFARHGRRFIKPWVQRHFESQPWYQTNPGYGPELLTAIDRHNVALVEQAENAIDPVQLRLMRNTVFARRGRVFTSPDLVEHFKRQPWYRPDPGYTDARLTEDDKIEIELIQEFERRAATVPDLRDWAPGKRLEAKALAAADAQALFELYLRMAEQLSIDLGGFDCQGVLELSARELDCDALEAGERKVDKLGDADRRSVQAVERALARAYVFEGYREPMPCEEDCAWSEGDELRICLGECQGQRAQQVKEIEAARAAAVAKVDSGQHPTRGKLLDDYVLERHAAMARDGA